MAKNTRHILAMSNSSAFFAEPSTTPVLAKYLMGLTGKDRPTIVHVGAANGDSAEKSGKFFALAQIAGFEPRHLNLFALEDGNPETFFTGADAIYIDGGSTRNLRALLKEWSADKALKRAYKNGVVLSGASAGANILFEWGMTDSVKTRIEATRGLGILKGTMSVHSDVREDRGEALEKHLNGIDATYPAYAINDGTALHFENEVLHHAISLNESANMGVDENGEGLIPHPVSQIS
ncbi:Type 1 glutamine amidotransferase-like domain-containing protein [Erythrobacter crassostreae]|uniref:Type 1 glutamine amidotransferase-like domain-containing protein n=1 Tax=Erythrobacter crassostreae TaxID=2828328 RepID=A0A9X1JL51_9SPHN|nr:Type 1 glutamine amidotransferase-like domain-containing protein [Erythrobacter crassostrea]MBV7257964.1 Type 1 glutamine amidotransferase-like domain-containing protein [Erythrobacter crassostrea]